MTRLYLVTDLDGTELVQAVQWTGSNFAELERFAPGAVRFNVGALEVQSMVEGWDGAEIGDWVAIGAEGLAYLETADNFARLYKTAAEGVAP